MRSSSIERRLELAEAKAGTSGGFFNPRSAAQSAIAARYWHVVIHEGKVSQKLQREYDAIPRLQCAADTNKVIYERLAEGILGGQEKPAKSVRAAAIHEGKPRAVVPEGRRLPPPVDAPLSFRCLHRCQLGGLVWMPGQIFDNLARERGCPEPPDNGNWERFNPRYEEVPARTIRVRALA